MRRFKSELSEELHPLWPSEHLPARREAADKKYAHVLEQANND
jgi:hypothetical protein